MRTAILAALAALATAPGPVPSGPSLAVDTGGTWQSWWSADRAPDQWTAALPALAATVEWAPAAGGVEQAEIRLSGGGEAWRVRVILARFDPDRARIGLAYTPDRLNRPDRWSVEDAPAAALLAVNAGQFNERGPWGWMVDEGIELREPGRAPLAPAIVADSAGTLRFVPPDSIATVRARGGIRMAFQSYPALLMGDGIVPAPLREDGLGVRRHHRDARLALCELRDGRWLAALTRFEGLGGALSNLPFGLTTPEMAALAGALGCRQAVLLDGGMSGQLMIRQRDGSTGAWTGLRRVPAGLLVTAATP